MQVIKATQLEKKVLEALAREMYAERGFSDVGIKQVVRQSKLEPQTIRAVISSLVKKDLVEVDMREGAIIDRLSQRHVIYLKAKAEGLVSHWVEEEPNLEPATIEVKN